jgi:hypothetical protein
MKYLGKGPPERTRRWWDDNITMDLEKVGCEDGGQMELAEDRVQCQGLVLAVMGLHVLLRADDRIWGPPNFLACGYPGIKQPESEAYHSPLCSAEAKNAWRCNSTLLIRLHSVVLS